MNEEPPPAPRDIPSIKRLMSFGILFALLFGGIWALTGGVVGTVFMVVGGPPWHDWAIDRAGVSAMAQVTGVTPTSSRINGRWVKRLSVAFRDSSGAPRTAEVSTADPAILGVASTGQVEIEFLPDRPHIVRVKGGRASFFGAFILIPAGFFVVGGIISAVGIGLMLGRRRVYRDGNAARARVTGSRATSGRVNFRRVYRVHYEFEGPSGRETGSYTTLHPHERGHELWILFDREDPRRNLPA